MLSSYLLLSFDSGGSSVFHLPPTVRDADYDRNSHSYIEISSLMAALMHVKVPHPTHISTPHALTPSAAQTAPLDLI